MSLEKTCRVEEGVGNRPAIGGLWVMASYVRCEHSNTQLYTSASGAEQATARWCISGFPFTTKIITILHTEEKGRFDMCIVERSSWTSGTGPGPSRRKPKWLDPTERRRLHSMKMKKEELGKLFRYGAIKYLRSFSPANDNTGSCTFLKHPSSSIPTPPPRPAPPPPLPTHK